MQDSFPVSLSKSPVVGQVHDLLYKTPSPLKKKLKKLRQSDVNPINWRRNDILLSLFKAVIANEPHLKTSNEDKRKAWLETKQMLFLQDIMLDYTEQKDSDSIVRNMKYHYKLKYESVLAELGVGDLNGGTPSNLSRFDGELAPLEKLVKQIYQDIEVAAEKRDSYDLKKVLNQVEADTWKVNQSKPLRVKSGVKGTITDNSVSKSSRSAKTFDSVIIDMLSNEHEASTTETSMETTISEYCNKHSFTIDKLYTDANIKDMDPDKDILNELGLNVLVGMYCSPGLKFASGPFKSDLDKCSVKTLNALKLYKALQNLSKAAVDEEKVIATIQEQLNLEVESGPFRNEDLGTTLEFNCIDSLKNTLPVEVPVQQLGEDFLGYIVRIEDNNISSI